MSLDVYLISEKPVVKESTSGIFIRENGTTKEITAAEWYARNPDSEPIAFNNDSEETNELYSANITHNLGTMANKAGIYEALWRPEEIGITKALQLIVPLSQGVERLLSNPDYYRQFDSANGWGTYDGFVPFVQNYLKACIDNPNAAIEVSR